MCCVGFVYISCQCRIDVTSQILVVIGKPARAYCLYVINLLPFYLEAKHMIVLNCGSLNVFQNVYSEMHKSFFCKRPVISLFVFSLSTSLWVILKVGHPQCTSTENCLSNLSPLVAMGLLQVRLGWMSLSILVVPSL